jgi:hypothetical protein
MMMSPLLKVRSPTHQGFGQNSAESAHRRACSRLLANPVVRGATITGKGMEIPKIPQVARWLCRSIEK